MSMIHAWAILRTDVAAAVLEELVRRLSSALEVVAEVTPKVGDVRVRAENDGLRVELDLNVDPDDVVDELADDVLDRALQMVIDGDPDEAGEIRLIESALTPA
ncbi:hypothetical protein ACIPY5_00230 [Microbacterium sp. NPDC089698]|uniref:hypothetical protein n=1 Tax=Microbacterium sp. NPDC089698 TaxID=3364200 RepID=UPI0037FC79B1